MLTADLAIQDASLSAAKVPTASYRNIPLSAHGKNWVNVFHVADVHNWNGIIHDIECILLWLHGNAARIIGPLWG